MKQRSLIVLGLVCLGLGWHGPAEAGSGTAVSELTFDSSNYTVRAGGTVTVSVLFSQVPTGGSDAVISTLNPLLLASFQITITNLTGTASVLSTSNITSNTVAFSTPPSSSVSPTLVKLAESTLGAPFGPPGLGSLPGVLGTFTFTGIQTGTTQITVAPIPGGSSFADASFDELSPTSATAIINTIPEPSSILIVLSGGPLFLAGLVLRRSRRGATPESRQ